MAYTLAYSVMQRPEGAKSSKQNVSTNAGEGGTVVSLSMKNTPV